MGRIRGAMANVRMSHGGGHQGFNLLSNQFLAGIAKHLFRGLVQQNDAAINVHFKNGIRCGFQELPEPALIPGSRGC
jgi:hypothetical protein